MVLAISVSAQCQNFFKTHYIQLSDTTDRIARCFYDLKIKAEIEKDIALYLNPEAAILPFGEITEDWNGENHHILLSAAVRKLSDKALRFLIAHELGHIKFLNNPYRNPILNIYDYRQAQADSFAVALVGEGSLSLYFKEADFPFVEDIIIMKRLKNIKYITER